jgi:hypothetical protein
MKLIKNSQILYGKSNQSLFVTPALNFPPIDGFKILQSSNVAGDVANLTIAFNLPF